MGASASERGSSIDAVLEEKDEAHAVGAQDEEHARWKRGARTGAFAEGKEDRERERVSRAGKRVERPEIEGEGESRGGWRCDLACGVETLVS
eukprot:3674873-Rhodomonas_salina.3